MITLLSFTQFSMADIQSDEQSATQSSDAKPLKVEEGATKVGEKVSKENIEKTRSLKLEYANEQKDTNMNIGKIEFFVK